MILGTTFNKEKTVAVIPQVPRKSPPSLQTISHS